MKYLKILKNTNKKNNKKYNYEINKKNILDNIKIRFILEKLF